MPDKEKEPEIVLNQEQQKIGQKKDLDLDVINLDKDENILEQDSSYIQDIEDNVKHANRQKDRGLINENNNSTILIRDNGDISLSTDKMSQIKISKSDKSVANISQNHRIITNRISIKTEDLEVNDHKFNQRIWELADQRVLSVNEDSSMGNLNMSGYVLMKHWEAELGKWVLIRRKTRMPIFYPEKTLPDVPKEMSIDTKINLEHQEFTGDKVDLFIGMFGLAEKDPAFQEAENNIELEEESLIIDTQVLDPREEIFIDMGPIDANTGIVTQGSIDGGMGGGYFGGSAIAGAPITGNGTDQAGNPIELLSPSLPSKKINYNKTQTVTHKMPEGYETTQPNDSRINKVPADVMCYNIDKVGNINLSPHFKLSQFRSGCGSPYILISPLLIQKLEQLCSSLGVNYIKINSGYRSPAHNEAIKRQGYKASDRSEHMFGRAADLWVNNKIGPKQIENAARKLGFAYVYSKPGFCHVNV